VADLRSEILTFTTSDGYLLTYRVFNAVEHPNSVEHPKATVVFIHGIQSHGGWYESSCKNLARDGYRILFLDRRGSGLNQVTRGDSPSFRTLIDDLKEFLVEQRKGLKEKERLFLGAISWGGKIAFGLDIRHPGLFDGLILVAPGFCPKIQPTFLERLRIAFGWLFVPRKLFNIPLNDPDLFTTNPDAQLFLKNDPLALRQATARFLLDSVRLDFYLRIFRKKIEKPVLLLIAGQDRIIDNSKTCNFVKGFVAGTLVIKDYPKAHHTLEFEPEPQEYLADIKQWLADQI